MEEVETNVKSEIKEENILPLIESGMDVDNILTTIKKEDEDFIEALVKITKEEKFEVKYEDETKPSIISPLVKSCSELDSKGNQDDVKGLKGKREDAEDIKKGSISSSDEASNEAHVENITEVGLSEDYESDGTEGDFEDSVCSHGTYKKILNHTGKPFCGKPFLRSQSLKQHLLTHEEKKPFKCAQYPMAFRKKSLIIRHIERTHSHSNKTFTCEDCGKTFNHKSSLTQHLKNIHIQEQMYICKICGFASRTKANLKTHEKLHENVYPFKCKYCTMSFKQKISLKSHCLQVHESRKLFNCAECDSSFKMKCNLVAHIQVHHNITENMFACDICNMKFKRKCYLNRHVETHTDADKKYICDDCGLGCRSKTDIAKHVLTHIGAVEKPFMCQVCGMCFAKRSDVVRHERVHSDKKIFTCDLCDKAYKDPYSLKDHHQSVHLKMTFSCNSCGFKSTNNHSFKRHVRQCKH